MVEMAAASLAAKKARPWLRRRAPILIAAIVLVIGAPLGAGAVGFVALTTDATISGCDGAGGSGGGSSVVDQRVIDASQADLARTIVSVVAGRHLPRRAAVIAIATALVESGLRNLDHGDRDSLGLYQQRPSQGWGTPADILNPVHATNTFLDHLVQIPNWATLPPGEAEQDVQRSAFPGRYAPQEHTAESIVAKYWQGPDNPVPAPPPTATSPEPGAATAGCSDQGGSNLPVTAIDPHKLPPGYQLPTDPRARAAVSYALAQLGKPYVWGAKGPNSFDCSGLMLAAWAQAGIGLPAGTTAQVHAGTPVPSLAQVQPGDLLFIPGSLGSPQNPRHVGMFVGDNTVIDAYDEQKGVILESLATWRPKVVAIRHVG